MEILSAELEYIPLNPVHLAEDQAPRRWPWWTSSKQDDDVQEVFHNLA